MALPFSYDLDNCILNSYPVLVLSAVYCNKSVSTWQLSAPIENFLLAASADSDPSSPPNVTGKLSSRIILSISCFARAHEMRSKSNRCHWEHLHEMLTVR